MNRERQIRFGGGIVKALLVCAAAGALLGVAGCSSHEPAPPVDELSVVLVTLDTTRADHIGAFGGKIVPTPNLDRVAREGVRFTQAISQVPLTLPSHATMLTGRYPASHGVRHNGIYRVPDSETTLTERLDEQGFSTAAFIAAFVVNRGYGLAQGFDVYDDIEDDRYDGSGEDRLFEAERTAEEVNARVFEWLDGKPDGRSFLWVHYYDPHEPYEPPATTGHALNGTGYAREISYVDACFGDLVARLERDGILDRSILVVVGDHGESLGEHREKTHGIFLYESAVHVPLIIRAPGLVPRGEVVDDPVELVDLAPTVLDLLQLPPLEGAQGLSLAPQIHGEGGRDGRLTFAETLMPRLEFGWSELRMVRDDRYKYIAAPRAELYDIREDPGEKRNLLAEKRKIGQEMAALIDEWVEDTARSGPGQDASVALSAEDEQKLRSLGYLGGSSFKTDGSGTVANRPDPKDQIDEALKLDHARALLDAEKYDESITLVTEILRGTPENHLARTTRIRALIQLGRLEESEREAEAAVIFAENDPDGSLQLLEKARRMLASIYWMRDKNQEAEAQYRMAIELNQTNAGAPVFPGLLLGAAGGTEEARRLVAGVLARNPNDGAALAAKFELELAAKEHDEALLTAERLAEVKAGDTTTLIKAGRILSDAGKPGLAADCYEAAQAKTAPDPDLLGFLGTARLAAGQLDRAEAALLQVKELRPEDPRTSFYLGNISLIRNDEAAARSHFEESLRLQPQFVPPLVNLAQWLDAQGRRDEAIQVLNDALERRPGDPGASAVLARLTDRRSGSSGS